MLKKYGDIFLHPEKYPADGTEFRQAINGLLKELVLDAQKTGNNKDALQVLDAAEKMNAIPLLDVVRLRRELDNLRVATSNQAGEKPGTPDLPAGFHQMTTHAGEGKKFVNYSLGGKGACDEVVSFPKDGDGKGNKTLVSAHSGYAVELVGVVDGRLVVRHEPQLSAVCCWSSQAHRQPTDGNRG